MEAETAGPVTRKEDARQVFCDSKRVLDFIRRSAFNVVGLRNVQRAFAQSVKAPTDESDRRFTKALDLLVRVGLVQLGDGTIVLNGCLFECNNCLAFRPPPDRHSWSFCMKEQREIVMPVRGKGRVCPDFDSKTLWEAFEHE